MRAEEVGRLLRAATSIAMVSHANPDGDAIGSLLALAMGLQQLGKTVWVLGDEPLPEVFAFLPGNHLYRRSEDDVACDAVIYLDCASRERATGHPARFAYSINIDHHADNTRFADYNWVEVDAAATGELVFLLLCQLEVEVDEDMATCLYAAVASDTGWFAYENTRALTHRIAADLLQRGVQSYHVASRLQLGRRYPALKLLGIALESMELALEGRASLMTLLQSDYERVGAHAEDANGIVQYGGMLRDVEVSVLMKEVAEQKMAVSLRSFGQVNVQEIAAQLGGGGHVKAAGCTLTGDASSVRAQLLRVIAEALSAAR